MKISILGTGMVGRTIASKLNELGHQVTIGTRNVSLSLSKDEPDVYGNPPLKDWHKNNPQINLNTFAESAESAEIIFNCTAGLTSLSALESAGQHNLKGKILIDIANPLDFSKGMPPTLNPVNSTSLAEQIQEKFPETKVVKTLNTMTASIMVNPEKLSGEHNVFISGNDAQAKKDVTSILYSFGWQQMQIIDLGDITSSRGTEMILPIWLRIYQSLGTAEFNFYIQKK